VGKEVIPQKKSDENCEHTCWIFLLEQIKLSGKTQSPYAYAGFLTNTHKKKKKLVQDILKTQ
jgi:hypothetical protein